MHGATTTARCATGAARQATISKTVTALGIAIIAHAAAMMALIVSIPTTSAMSSRTVRSILLTPILSAGTALLLTMTLTSKGR